VGIASASLRVFSVGLTVAFISYGLIFLGYLPLTVGYCGVIAFVIFALWTVFSASSLSTVVVALSLVCYGVLTMRYLPVKLGAVSALAFSGFAVSLLFSEPVSSEPEPLDTEPPSARGDPSQEFAKPPKRAVRATATTNLPRAFVSADRPTASVGKGCADRDGAKHTRAGHDDELAVRTAQKLRLTRAVFTAYVENFKAFVVRTVLRKLVRKLDSDKNWVKAMLTIESFECRDYIRARIKDLAASANLAGHQGSFGIGWEGREWTAKFPSDNRIVMLILGLWLSYWMNGRQSGKVRPTFNERFLVVNKEPSLSSEDEVDPIKVSTDAEYRRFFVHTRWEGVEERFCGPPGRDSMYGALTLFFWFIKRNRKFLLDGADLKASPICMDRVFEPTRHRAHTLQDPY
jgi:hypothetical protein